MMSFFARKGVFSVLIFVLCARLGAAAQLPKPLAAFSESSALLLKGVADRSEASLIDAAEGFSSFYFAELPAEDFLVEETVEGSLVRPLLQFNAGYCDKLRKENFTIVERDQLSDLRAKDADASLVSYSLLSGGGATFTFAGADRMALCMASDSALRYGLTADGGEIPLTLDATGVTASAQWDMEAEGPFTLTVSNPTDRRVSFTIAIQ